MSGVAVVGLVCGVLAAAGFLRSGRVAVGAAAAAAFAVATWADPLGLPVAVGLCAAAGLLGAAPRWAGEAGGASAGFHRGFAVATVLGLPAVVTASGVWFATWQSSR